MNTALGCDGAAAAIGPATSAPASAPLNSVLRVMSVLLYLVGKRPQAQFLLGYLPEPRQSVRLDNQKEDDETAEHHQLELLLQGDRQAQTHRPRRVREEDRHQHDEGGAEEGSEDRAEAADDHHEQDEEGQRDVEGPRLGTAAAE